MSRNLYKRQAQGDKYQGYDSRRITYSNAARYWVRVLIGDLPLRYRWS